MKKKVVIPQSNTKKAIGKKKPVSPKSGIYPESFTTPYYEYRHMTTRDIIGVYRTDAVVLGVKLLEYVRRPGSLRVETFHLDEGITAEAWKSMCDLFEELRDALIIAKNILGDKRLQLGLEKKYDANLASYALHQYHPDWKAAEKYHDDRDKEKIKLRAEAMKDANQKGDVNITVVRQNTPNSDLVRDFKKKEDK